MSMKTDALLMGQLAELSRLYPDLRFGQVVSMLALLSGDEAPPVPAEVDDDRLIEVASQHLRLRRHQLQPEDGFEPGSLLPASRAELLNVLERVHDLRRDRRLGHLVEQLAISAGSSLYDAEDEQLLATARVLLDPPG